MNTFQKSIQTVLIIIKALTNKYTTMKTFETFIAVIFAVFTTTANAQERMSFTDLQHQVAEINSQLPMSLGDYLEWESLEITSEQLTFSYLYEGSKSQIPHDANTNEFKKDFALRLIGELIDEDSSPFFESVASSEINICLEYIIRNSEDSLTYIITPEELEEVISLRTTEDEILTKEQMEEMLQREIQESRKTCPIVLGQGIIIKDIILTPEFLEYHYLFEVDAFRLTEDEYAMLRDNLKEFLVQSIASNTDATLAMSVALCGETGRGIAYVIKLGKSKKTIRVQLSNKELEEMFEIYEDEE